MMAYLQLARDHAPLLAITLPLIGAGLALVLPVSRLAWLISVAAALGAALLVGDFAWRALVQGAPLQAIDEAIALEIDGVSVFGAALVCVIAALTVIGAGALLRELESRAAPFALACLLCVGAGWTAALFARDFIGVILAVEAAWLACVGLAALSGERDRGALNGALRMLSVGGAGAALMLLGAGLIYRAVGSMNVDALSAVHTEMPGVATAGVGLVIVALVLKAGIPPFHFWAGATLGRTSGIASMAIGVIGSVAALGLIARIGAHAIAAPGVGEGVSAALATIGAAGVVIGSFQAAGARNAGRLAAYACAAQGGGVLLCVGLGSPAGFAAGLVQLFSLAAAALALFGGFAVGRVKNLEMLDGFGRRAPLASVAITAGAMALMGAPLTVGFLGRWRLIEAGVGAGWWWAAGAVIVASLAGVFYGGRLVERIYFRRANTAFEGESDMWRAALAPAFVFAIVAIWVGLAPSLLLRAAANAAALLAGGAV